MKFKNTPEKLAKKCQILDKTKKICHDENVKNTYDLWGRSCKKSLWYYLFFNQRISFYNQQFFQFLSVTEILKITRLHQYNFIPNYKITVSRYCNL